MDDDDLLCLVVELCNCAKLGRDYLLKSRGKRVSKCEGKTALPLRGAQEKLFEFKLGNSTVELSIDYDNNRIDVSRYNQTFGIACSLQACDNCKHMKAGINLKIEHFDGMTVNRFITQKEDPK